MATRGRQRLRTPPTVFGQPRWLTHVVDLPMRLSIRLRERRARTLLPYKVGLLGMVIGTYDLVVPAEPPEDPEFTQTSTHGTPGGRQRAAAGKCRRPLVLAEAWSPLGEQLREAIPELDAALDHAGRQRAFDHLGGAEVADGDDLRPAADVLERCVSGPPIGPTPSTSNMNVHSKRRRRIDREVLPVEHHVLAVRARLT